VNVRNVHPQLQHRPSVALRTLWQLCLLVPEVGCPRSPAGLPSVRQSFSVSDGACDRPPTLPPPRHGNPRGSSRVSLEATGLWQWNLGSWFRASSAWHELCVLARHLAGRYIYWATVECSHRQDWEGDGQRSTTTAGLAFGCQTCCINLLACFLHHTQLPVFEGVCGHHRLCSITLLTQHQHPHFVGQRHPYQFSLKTCFVQKLSKFINK